MIKELFNTRKAADIITEILIFVLVILISTFILRLTWNNSLVKHITVLKKLDTFLDALLLSISLAVIRGI
jgi:flagellar biosynthesis protein FlhB|tara:strand:+ start:189 stop:398 length:210 start_codon:yes stop_codon:yes gene_type:complete